MTQRAGRVVHCPPGMESQQASENGAGRRRSSTFVVVPSFNEGQVLCSTIKPLIERGYSVVVVDDGSSDDSWSSIRDLPIHSLRHPINLGQGAALQTGMTYALRCGAEYVIHFDADGQHPLDQIEDLLEPVRTGQADVALGCRFMRLEDGQQVPRLKRVVLRGGAIVSGLMTGVWLRDSHNGFRALSRQAVEKIHLSENGFAHATEILREIRRHRLRYTEVPTTIRYSTYSMAKGQRISNAVNILMDLIIGKVLR